MNTIHRTLPMLALLAWLPGAALAQGGKIDQVERSARHSGGSGGSSSDDDDDGGGSVLGILFHIFAHSHRDASVAPDTAPHGPVIGLGFAAYPYAGPKGGPFVLRHAKDSHTFGVVSVTRFSDASSTLRATTLGWDGGFEDGHVALEGSVYDEPKSNETDHLYTARGEIGGVGQFLTRGLFTGGIGVRGLCLDNGTCAGGPDLGVTLTAMPAQPLALSVTQRLGGAKWHNGGWFWVTETNASASLFAGRFEFSGGWHWLKLGPTPAFAGPTFGLRVWF